MYSLYSLFHVAILTSVHGTTPLSLFLSSYFDCNIVQVMNKSEIPKSVDVKQQSINFFHLYNYNITYRYKLGCLIGIDRNFNVLPISRESPDLMGENSHEGYKDLSSETPGH